MIIHGNWIAEGVFEARCCFCVSPVGILSTEEVLGLLFQGAEVYCFDCDQDADLVPEVLSIKDRPLMFEVGEERTVLDPYMFGTEPTETVGLRLSILTYLSKTER